MKCSDLFWGSSTGCPQNLAIEDDNTIAPTALTRSDASCIVFRFELAGYHADDIQVAIVDDEILRWIYLQAGRTQQLFEPDLDTPNELLFPTAFLHSSCAIRVVLVTNKDHGEELEFWSLEGNQVAIEVGAALAMDEIKPDVSWKMVQRDGRLHTNK
ncbi:hypothetical protein BLNAU_5262 [Blattamonas nauphoetae]|uniref:Uncharacterized protein n=1 Tax=Blattamonas nauphoetae TaxID=2049346 RepID=A0ABQ9WY96_9EUKA|nr:hypothetical protein BLNAU_20641 [Blattamonas nauphoetae]KAK2959773.1 hypothetical protein BLNAU_5262 [Blattamonas nauphoetae]